MLWLHLLLLAGCSDYEVVHKKESDIFEQLSRDAGVDILWVLDNSGTMYEEHQTLEANAEAFITLLSIVPVDFQLGVVTTDADTDTPGVLIADVLTPDTPELSSAFLEAITVETNGSRTEEGFVTTLAGADPEGPNPTFARADADLEVIVFSDEDDQSELSPDDFVFQLQAPRVGRMARVNAMVGDIPDGCFSVTAAADAGSRYLAAQEATGGLAASMCTTDFETVLHRLALYALGMADTFYLSRVPAPESLEVRVDDAIVPNRETDGWIYNPGDNSIVFDGYAVPPPGAYIIVSYFEWLGANDTGTPLGDTGG